MMHRGSRILIFCFLIQCAATVCAEKQLKLDDLWDLSPEQLLNVEISSIATGTMIPLDKSAAVATVITEKDIIAMGATDIADVLETVPGLHVGISNEAFSPKFNIRGITSKYNSQPLVLINGIPITGLFTGNRSNVWGGMPIKAVKRIEVIRGPGSALYGADALSGVINIVTKSSKDINGTHAGVRVGSFDTKAGWLEHGGHHAGFDIGFILEYQSTNGWKEIVDADILGNSGPVSTGVKSTEMRLDMIKGNWSLRAGYQGRRDLGVGVGLAPVLDPEAQYDSDRVNFDSTYIINDVVPGMDVQSSISYYYNTQEVAKNPTLFPAGIFPGFPDGVIGAPGYKEEHARFNLSTLYSAINTHLIRVGTGAFWGDLYETTEKKNFDFDPSSAPPFTPKPNLIEAADTADIFLSEADRTSYYIFVQDEWLFSDRWALTSGVRFDHYSDFGNTTNPRLGLVWATTESITTKLLYGRAFRAPSFIELFATSNPVVLGNPDLDPETIDTYEFAFSHQVSSDFHYTANLFYYDIEDYIAFTGIPGEIAQNSGNRTGKGGEFEFDYSMTPQLNLTGNYAYQKSIDGDTHKAVGEAPNHQAYGRVEWTVGNKWSFSPQINWVGKQQRVANDTRASVAHYTTVDLTIRQTNIIKDFSISLSIKNFFDRGVFKASSLGGVPGDFPMAGRSVYGEVEYTF